MNIRDIESTIEGMEQDAEQAAQEKAELQTREATVLKAIEQLQEDVKMQAALEKNREGIQQEKQAIEEKIEGYKTQIADLESNIQSLIDEKANSTAILEQLSEMGEDITSSLQILEERQKLIELCQEKLQEIIEKLGLGSSAFGETSAGPSAAVSASASNAGSIGAMESFADDQTPMQALADYMSSHNYGIDDYDEYSKDPEWQRLHQAVFPAHHQISEHEFTREQKVDWVSSVVPVVSRTDAERIVNACEHYSGNGYNTIHWDKNASSQSTKEILKVFDNNGVPPYQGTIYRGLSFDSKRDLKKALKRNREGWSEPGITSFSSNPLVAEHFAGKGEWGLVLTCKNNKSAIPFKHMSLITWEDEVLSPGGLRNNGWEIDKKSMKVDRERHIVYAEIIER